METHTAPPHHRPAAGFHPPRPLLLLALCCTAAAACAGEAEPPPAAAEATATPLRPRQSAAGGPRDACDLIPPEQVAAIVGGPVLTSSDPGPHESRCAYTDQSGRYPYVELKVYWTGGREMLEIVQAGTAIAARLLVERPGDEAVVDSIVRPGPVAGLGDRALYSDIMPSYVLTGDLLLELEMPLLPDARQHFRPLATTALARLSSSTF